MPLAKLTIVPPHGTAVKNEHGSNGTVYFDPEQCHPLRLYEGLVKSLQTEVEKFIRANPKYMPAQDPVLAAAHAATTVDPLDLSSRRIDPDERHLREAKGPKDCLQTGQHDAASMRRIPRSEDGICNDCGTQIAGYFKALHAVSGQSVPGQVSPMTNPFVGPAPQALSSLAVSEEVINGGQQLPLQPIHTAPTQAPTTEPAPPPVATTIVQQATYRPGENVETFSGATGRIVRMNRFSDGLEGEWYLVAYTEAQKGRKQDWVPVEELRLQAQGV